MTKYHAAFFPIVSVMDINMKNGLYSPKDCQGESSMISNSY